MCFKMRLINYQVSDNIKYIPITDSNKNSYELIKCTITDGFAR